MANQGTERRSATNPLTSEASRLRGMVYGAAFGDAWGYPTEFKSFKSIMAIIGVEQRVAPPNPLVITDDTQMHLCTLDAIVDNWEIFSEETSTEDLLHDPSTHSYARHLFAGFYHKFFHDPKNNRAPGNTVMTALERIDSAKASPASIADNNSLGCGTVMRAPWIGALPLERDAAIALGALQAQVTHGDPKGWVISALSVDLIHRIFTGEIQRPTGSNIPNWLLWYALESAFHLASLNSPLLPAKEVGEVIDDLRGFIEQNAVLKVQSTTVKTDVCSIFGQGWIADEALYAALGVVSAYAPDEVKQGIHRLVATNGDSDSLASIGGALFGALYGYDSLNHDVEANMELHYQPLLSDVVTSMTEKRLITGWFASHTGNKN